MGYDVLLVGRKLPYSVPLKPREYRTKRMTLIFRKGPAFYAEYNIRLFLFLLFRKASLILSNDLDTLLGARLAAVIRRIPQVHDCHEYYRGVPELNGRTGTIRAWKCIEDHIFPKLRCILAVNRSVADLYSNEYKKEITVIRNVPVTKPERIPKDRTSLGIPPDAKIILYQGAVNIDRGIEEAIEAMKLVNSKAILLILGTGDIFGKLQELVKSEGLSEKVILAGAIPLEELHSYTCLADIGLSIEKNVSINYYLSLPNKFLDYIQARVPVLVSPFPEMKTIVEKYDIGEMIERHDADYLAGKIDAMLNDPEKISVYKKNLDAAARDLCWENEEAALMRILEPYG
jgi:glycosyltransferase involved in cell wall biosynthesis